ncbi:MAG: cytochrome c3 family protein [Thermodesulfobacteriota bacterium]
MRLSKEGTLVCYSCHDHHGRRSFSHMLRVDMGRVCTACHKGH